MKRLSSRRRHWFTHRRRVSAKTRRGKLARHGRVVEIFAPSGAAWTANEPSQKSAMPQTVCFNSNCWGTLRAISDLRKTLTAVRPRRSGNIKISKHRGARRRQMTSDRYRSFETMELITPAAALVLASEHERMKILTGSPPWAVNVRKWSPQVFMTLFKIGFFDIVGFPSGEAEPNHDEQVVVVRMRSGQTADVNAINSLITDLKSLYPASEQTVHDSMTHLYGAMLEAVGNVCGHA